MKISKYFLILLPVIIIIILLLFKINSAFNVSNSNFLLEIKLNKLEYYEGESTWITYKITNTSIYKDSLANLGEITLLFNTEVFESNGKKVEYKGIIDMLAYDKYTIFNPGESKEFKSSILTFFNSKGFGYFGYLPSGSYSIHSKINDIDGKLIVKSNVISFSIIKPEGNELLAFNDINEIDSIISKRGFGSPLKNSDIDMMRNFLYKFPQSIFTGNLLKTCNILREMYKCQWDSTVLSDIDFYVKNNLSGLNEIDIAYHTEHLIIDCIVLIKKTMGGYSKSVEYLNGVKEKYNNDILTKIINKKIEEYKK